MDRVAGGDLNHRLGFSRISCREFASQGQSFNTMTDNLLLSRKKLDEYARTLEDKVKERTRDLQEAQAELLNQAHQAGMAEMAVGVLHNIGNAITPAKVEAQVLATQLQESRLRTGLDKALEELPDFITVGTILPEKKERLHAIISLLPASITQEYDRAIAGLNNISDKHRYIENIISLQMHYARLHGTPDCIDCNPIILDSLKIIDKQLQQEQIQVTTNFQATANVCLEESKLLQVLVNLIKNSADALAGTDPETRTLHLSSTDHKGQVIITVTNAAESIDGQLSAPGWLRPWRLRQATARKTVSSGEAAVAYLVNNSVDLVLLDMIMDPGMDGYQTYEKIKKIHPEQKALVISGFSESRNVQQTLALGAGGFIRKPYTLEQLGKGILKILADL